MRHFWRTGRTRPETDDERARNPHAPSGRRPWWAIAGLAAIAALALGLYTWSLSRNGMANSYYAAAVKSASVSWKAFFFGSLDPGSFITIDKPPAAIWVMAIFARIFGFGSWSMLIPQALAGVGSVLVLYRLVRRWAGEIAGLLAALAFALTPVATLIFRYNNPDAFLMLLLLLATWGVWAAVESGSTLKLTLAGVALGFAFLTKMLMAFMVLPALVLVYLLFGPPRIGKRLAQLLAAAGAMIVSGGWWPAIAMLWPEATRPYVGGTTTNSWIDLIFSRTGGYLGTTSSGGHLAGDPSWLRLFNDSLGGQVSWLLPLALAGLVAGLWLTRKAKRTDKARAGWILWGLWTVVMALAFDFLPGTFHSYYTVVLAPGAAALAGAGCVGLWRISRSRPRLAWVLPLVVAGSAAWSAALLWRTSDHASGLAPAVIALGIAAAIVLLALLVRQSGSRTGRIWALGATSLGLVALLAGPFAYDLTTVGRSINGNSPAAGPVTSGLLGASVDDLSVDEGLVEYLQANQADAEFLVGVQTSSASVPLILATGEPVMTIGGYKSRDPVPTVEQLEAMVAVGEIHCVLIRDTGSSGSSGSGGSDSSASTKSTLQAVTDWVTENGTEIPASDYNGDSAEGILYYLD